MSQGNAFTRRSALKAAGAGVAAATLAAYVQADPAEPYKPKGNIRQSVCRWCYGRIPLEKLTVEAGKMGYQSIELLGPEEIKTVKKLGLTCSIMRCANGIVDGLNRVQNHDKIVQQLHDDIDFAVAEGIEKVLCMSGNRRGMADDEGLAHCAAGLKRIVGYAEQNKITICMEGLNSRIDHKDYMYDKTAWGVELCKRVGSPRFKLLYDIYHMQIQEGDVIHTIRDNKEYIAHYHTGGVPGRHEIDETQELNYPAIVKAILDTGYKGFLGQEYIPAHDPLPSLAAGLRICDV